MSDDRHPERGRGISGSGLSRMSGLSRLSDDRHPERREGSLLRRLRLRVGMTDFAGLLTSIRHPPLQFGDDLFQSTNPLILTPNDLLHYRRQVESDFDVDLVRTAVF